MDMKELLDAVRGVVKEEMAPVLKDVTDLKASTGRIEASSVLHKVKPHSDRIRACADAMEAEGMGGHERHGHVAVLHRMADKMDAEAVLGKIPHLWRDHDWLEAAAAGDDALKTANAKVEELTAKVKELESKSFSASAAPVRPTDAAAAAAADKTGLHASHTDIRAKDAELKASGASLTQRGSAILLSRMQAA